MSRIWLPVMATAVFLSIVPQYGLALCNWNDLRDAPCNPVHKPKEEPKPDPEKECEKTLIHSWQATMPSLGFAGNGAAQAIDDAIRKQLDKSWMKHSQFTGGRWPGLTVAIAHGSRLVFAKSYGFADLAAPQLTHPDDLYRIASVSKQLTGATVLKLIHKGQSVDGNPNHKLALDTKIFDVLTAGVDAILPPGGIAALHPELKDITVEQVLHHTGGWTCAHGDPVWYAKLPNAVLPVTERNVVRKMMTEAPAFANSGTVCSYSNFGYNLLASLITKITGKDYETVVKQQVLRPIGIVRTKVGKSLLAGRADGEVRYYAWENSPSEKSLFPADTGATISGADKIPYGSWSVEAGRGAGGWIASSIDTLRFQLGINGRGTKQVYPNIFSDITSPLNQPSQEMLAGQCSAKAQPKDPSLHRYDAGWGVHIWGPTYSGWGLDHGGGVNGSVSSTVSIPDAPNMVGYGVALVLNTSPAPSAPPGAFDPFGAVYNAMQTVLSANGGSLLDPAWSADVDFFDQYGDFSEYMSGSALDARIGAARKTGCKYQGKTYQACYPSRIEGRRDPGKAPRFRAQFVPLHFKDQAASTFGASCSTYVKFRDELKAKGYQPINLQWYTDANAHKRFQAAWIKLAH